MQLNNLDNIDNISQKTGFAIFEIPEGNFAELLPKAIHAKPNEKGYYSVEEIREVMGYVQNKQESDLTIVFEDAETINTNGINAFLKNLEEPNDFIHFVFLVHSTVNLLPTVLSRAHCYYLPHVSKISDAPDIDPDILALAKRYISATPQQLPKIASDIAKDKNDARAKSINVVDAAIQLLYKSYFLTGNPSFLNKLDNLLKTQEALKANGHIKLQLVANML